MPNQGVKTVCRPFAIGELGSGALAVAQGPYPGIEQILMRVGSAGATLCCDAVAPSYSLTGAGGRFQMSAQYSPMARSEENLPLRAVFRTDMRVQWSASCQALLTCSWQAT